MLAILLGVVLSSAPALDQTKVQELQALVVSMRRDVAPRQSWRLARIALEVGARQGVDPMLLLAIARLESNFESGVRACWDNPRGPTCDHGLMQINDIWVHTWGLDPEALRSDDYLNMWTAARLLAQLRAQFGALEPNWYSRYHNNNPQKRQTWERKLHSFLRSYP